MTVIRTQRRKLLSNRPALDPGTGDPCLKTSFWAFRWLDAKHSASKSTLSSLAVPAQAYASAVSRPILPHSLNPELYSTPIVRPPAQFNAFYR
jgi:hypothetical protein